MYSNLMDYQQIAVHTAKESIAALIRYRHLFSLLPYWKKPDSSYVTPADYAVQYYLFKTFKKTFPNIPFIGEETLYETDAYKLPLILQIARQLEPTTTTQNLLDYLRPSPSPSTLFWLVDPIDGTSGFIKNRFFAIAISLMYEGHPILSVIASPTQDGHSFKIYYAAKNCGTYMFDSNTNATSPLQAGVVNTNMFCEASLSARNQRHWITKLLSERLSNKPIPLRADSQYKYAMVAENTVDFFIRIPFASSKAYSWDHAPGAFLIEEAGGIVSDLSGDMLHYNNEDLVLQNHPIIVATGNKSLHNEIMQALHNQLYTQEKAELFSISA